MQIKTILNRVQKYQSFIYTDFKLKEGKQLKLDITIHPRRNSRPICSGCGRKRPGYDTLPVRRFEFIPFWGILVLLCLCYASCKLPRLWHQSRSCPMG